MEETLTHGQAIGLMILLGSLLVFSIIHQLHNLQSRVEDLERRVIGYGKD